jgi:predicted RNase H-like HicB family nuclease
MTTKSIADYAYYKYCILLVYDPDGYWVARNPELPGCTADGKTEQEAIASLKLSREAWIESRLATNQDVPIPTLLP